MNLYMKKLFSFFKEKKKLFMSVMSVLVIGIAFGLLFYQFTSKSVKVEVNGSTKQMSTHASTVGEFMAESDIKVGKHDYLKPAASTKIKDDMTVVYKKANRITLNVNGKSKTIWTTAHTVNQVLTDNNLVLNDQDKVKPSPKENVRSNMTISYHSAFQVELNNGGTVVPVMTTETTVQDLLKSKQITLGPNDRVEPALSEKLTQASTVTITRVEKVTEEVKETLPFGVVKKPDDSLPQGSEKVIREGTQGLALKQVEIVRENGTEVSRQVLQSQTMNEPQDKVVAVGTKSVPAQAVAVSRGGGSAVAKEFYVVATAYSENCPSCTGLTKTGFNLRANPNAKVIAVDPSVIPLGTKVYVEGYGYAMALDTGGAIKGNRIDLYMPNESDAQRWGRKTVKIKILQ